MSNKTPRPGLYVMVYFCVMNSCQTNDIAVETSGAEHWVDRDIGRIERMFFKDEKEEENEP